MPLYLTAAKSSAFKRSGTTSGSSRSSASPFNDQARKKAANKRKRLEEQAEEDEDDEDTERLDDTGKVLPLAANSKLRTVSEAIENCLTNMFSEIPERAAGMNSTRIAEVLNFRKGLPPVVSIAHIHALITASTRTEREISQMISMGTLRKIAVAGRGNDISGLGEFVIRSSDLDALIDTAASLSESCKSAFKELLHANPRAINLASNLLQPSDLTSLVKAGFLVSSSSFTKLKNGTSSSNSATIQFSPPTAATRTPTGRPIPTKDSSFENLRSSAMPSSNQNLHTLTLSVPNLGPYLRLLSLARTYLITLLGKSKYKEAPAYLLKERWDGSADLVENRVAAAKRKRGEFTGVLPGSTKRWKDLYGLEFEWIMQECLGSGLVEEFETKSVGTGVRIV